MERRVLLAISLSFLVLFAYQTFVPAPDPATQPPAPGATAPSQPGLSATSQPAPSVAAGQPAAAGTASAALRADSAEREFVIETTSVRAVFTNRGARLK